ncbi:MAG: nucleotidyltransferase domain-containing protein [Sulfurospirillum sp.]|nr:nucleotidyltransferase domain-containing protein [Sulfurospirillum sp.]MBL0702394.1 nucleotidyltransferase domain-containing protein [Sulfurospirillum sp.]
MRLLKKEVLVLKKKLHSLSSEAKIYLFGSRVDDNKKGGDIDLLIVSKQLTKKELRYLRIDFFNHFGEQKMDILLDDGSFDDIFNKLIFQKAILL